MRGTMIFLKKKRNAVCLIIILVFVMASLFVYPYIYQKICKDRRYDDLGDKLNDDICSSNVRIVTEVIESNEGVDCFHYRENGCGVIFAYEENYYYVLTAAHVVDEKEKGNKTFYIVPYGSPTWQEANKKSKQETGKYLPSETFYNQFEKAEVDYVSESCDIAIIRFKSDEQFKCLEIANNEVHYGDKLVAFGSSALSGSDISYGKVVSKVYKTFDSHDGRNPDKVLFHNAYIVEGASGGAVLNEDFDIAGITIGGGTDLIGRFKYGAFIPSGLLKKVIQEWGANKTS